MIVSSEGRNGLPRLVVRAGDGAEAEVYLDGGHVTGWRAAGGREGLFLSTASEFAQGKAIRGGVPVIFPQFSSLGPLPKHGFARTTRWEWANEGQSDAGERVVLRLRETPETLEIWPHPFLLELTVEVGGDTLSLTLRVENTGASPFEFTAALHTYLRVEAIEEVRVLGLAGTRYRSTPEGVTEARDDAPELAIQGEIDRVYRGAPPQLEVADGAGGGGYAVSTEGFEDVVVWNPGVEIAARLPDVETAEYREMLCVEAAQVEAPVTLEPGARWTGVQRVRRTASVG
jgi:glucose-6-phosphate 1-epimerase